MPSVEPKSASKNALPPALQDLFLREAAFVLGRNRIGQALQVADDLKAAVARTRSWRSYIFKDNKNDHRAKRKELDADVEVLTAGVRKFENAGPTLYSCVQQSLENYLREHDPEYVNGLAASRFLDDWKRLLARFEKSLADFMDSLGRLPTTFETIDKGQVCGTSPECRQMLDQAVGTSRSVQEEIEFLNKIADAQRIRAGIDAITLYRQPERNWKTLIHSLHFNQPAQAVQEVRALVNDANDIAEKVRRAIQGEIQLASYVVGYGVTSYHERVWNSLRESAPLTIKPEDLETLLSETEDRIDEGRLEEWVPIRPENRPSRPVPPAPAPEVSDQVVAPAPAPAPAAAAVAAPPPSKAPGLKLNSRANGATPPQPQSTSTNAAFSKQAEDTVEDLMAERTRLEDIMKEMRSGFSQREEFLSQSEERLMQASQAQQEREMELEQREEQLRDLEKRLRVMKGGTDGVAAEALAQTPKKPMDEFNE